MASPYRELYYVEIRREAEASMHHWNFSSSQPVRQSLQLATHPVIYQSYRRELTCGIKDAWLSFGKPNSINGRRNNECLVLEPSEMIMINQEFDVRGPNFKRPLPPLPPARKFAEPQSDDSYRRRSHSATDLEQILGFEQPFHSGVVRFQPRELPVNCDPQHANLQTSRSMMRSHSNCSESQTYKRSSRASDTSSSIYSGDGDGPSLHDSSLLDSDDDGDYGTESGVTEIDAARECLEKNPDERTEDDIEVLLEFLQNLPAFANMTMSIRRALCAVMVYAVVEKAETVVMNDGEELDSWSVILNGSVKVTYQDGSSQTLNMGDSFGIKPTKEKEYHRGTMTTLMDDCQFVCIAQENYYEILSAGEENIRKHEENGEVVMITETRTVENGARHGDIVISGTPSRLVKHLIDDRSPIDMTYDEDFLLTYRIFLKSPIEIANRLLKWFEDVTLRERITRVVLLWVNNHFNDFESDVEMTEFLEKFEELLESYSMLAHLRFLHIACAAKARPRYVTLTRATRDEILHFAILGGVDQNCGIFIANVEKDSKAYEGGLKRGDQILEVNNANFENISHSKALEVLRGTTLLSITVKSNLLAFRDMLHKSDKSEGAFAVRNARNLIKITNKVADDVDASDSHQPIIGKKSKGGTSSKSKLMKMLAKMNILPKPGLIKTNSRDTSDSFDGDSRPRSNSLHEDSGTLTRSNSSPDVTQLSGYTSDSNGDIPEYVLKIYRSDQSYKFFQVSKDTTAREVVVLALRQFGISEHSSDLHNITCHNYSLCEISVEPGGLVKQKRLPDTASNLSDRIGVYSRYYLKNNMSQETLVPDDAVQDLVRETHFTFLQLHPAEIAVQLTMNDYKVFQDIEPTEYIDNLIGRRSTYGTEQLHKFEKLVNHEMFWVPTVICGEANVFRRMKCIKHFIKIAKHCKDFKNFNSMFAILSGLNTGTVSRLRNTWEKLPSKYQKMFDDLMFFLDPTRNMSKYRNLLSNASSTPPVIPIFPIVKKDLTFIELGNDTKVDGLINFEKMRMIAKEVRHIVGLASSQYIQALMMPSNSSGASSGSFFSNLQSGNMSGVVTIRRKKRSSTLIHNPKKMFEEAQMSRRVKAYLSTLEVQENEDKLNELSLACESKAKHEMTPSSGSMLSSMSPTLSGPKFGAEGVNINRMMALSEKSRPVSAKPPQEKLTSPTLSNRNSAQIHVTHPPLPQNKPKPVDLTSESSSVLGNLRAGGALRKLSNASSLSRSSTCSSQNKYVIERDENDSGHHSMYDSHSQSSTASSQQPSPPSNITTVTTTSASGQPSIHTRIHVPGPIKTQLPSYQTAAQMAYLSRQHQSVGQIHPPLRRKPAMDNYSIDGSLDDEFEGVVSAV